MCLWDSFSVQRIECKLRISLWIVTVASLCGRFWCSEAVRTYAALSIQLVWWKIRCDYIMMSVLYAEVRAQAQIHEWFANAPVSSYVGQIHHAHDEKLVARTRTHWPHTRRLIGLFFVEFRLFPCSQLESQKLPHYFYCLHFSLKQPTNPVMRYRFQISGAIFFFHRKRASSERKKINNRTWGKKCHERQAGVSQQYKEEKYYFRFEIQLVDVFVGILCAETAAWSIVTF